MNKFFIPALVFAASHTYAQEQTFTVYFPFNKDVTTASSGKQLTNWMSAHPNAVITGIEGYTDKTGVAVYNEDLSQRRIKYVQNRLQTQGYDIVKASNTPYGETRAKAGYSAPDRKVTILFTEQEDIVVAETPVKAEPSDFSKKISNAAKGDKIRVPNLNFYNNSDIVLPASVPVLKDLLKILQDNPTLKIDIQGHICCQKTETNDVSNRRALTIYKFLIASGIAKDRLSYKSFGSSRPIYPLPEKNEEERIANRRVEVEILSK